MSGSFHLHLISDAMAETLYAVAKAALAQFEGVAVQVRRNHLAAIGEQMQTDYTDLEKVRSEVIATRRLYEQQGWPSIDITRRSVEETAATIPNLLAERQEDQA